MRKRVQIALTVFFIATAGVITWQVLRPHEREPVYEGKPLSVWLSEYYYPWAKQYGPQREAEGALQRIGTNAIPILLKMMRKKDSPLVSILIPLWDRHITAMPYLPTWIRDPSWYRTKALVLNRQALAGFEVLGADAQQAVPELIAIYELNNSPDSQLSVSQALIAIGPEAARAAIPSFLRAAASSDARRREYAVEALAHAHVEPSRVVPALVKSLSDTNVNTRRLAALGLKEIGRSGGARQAVPALVLLLSDPYGLARDAATRALKQIDPEAAEKAGVKLSSWERITMPGAAPEP